MNDTVGNKLRKLRKYLGLTQIAFGAGINVSGTSISRLERTNWERSVIDLEVLYLISRKYNIDLAYWLDFRRTESEPFKEIDYKSVQLFRKFVRMNYGMVNSLSSELDWNVNRLNNVYCGYTILTDTEIDEICNKLKLSRSIFIKDIELTEFEKDVELVLNKHGFLENDSLTVKGYVKRLKHMTQRLAYL